MREDQLMDIHVKQELPFSFTSAEFTENPYPLYDRMRSICPLYRIESIPYPGWYVTGYEEAKKILLDTHFENRITLPSASNNYKQLKCIQSNMMLFQNEGHHRHLRRLVSEFFIPNKLEQYRPFVKETTQRFIQQAKQKEKIDIISDFSFPLASNVIGKIIGIPSEYMYKFRDWSATLVQAVDFSRTKESFASGNHTILELQTFFKNLISEKRLHSENDLISTLIKETSAEGKLNDEELFATLVLLVIAGHETTVNLIGNSILSLIHFPKQAVMLRDNPELIDTAIEEFLRFESPTQMTARIASRDINVGEVTIQKGEQVYIILGAANRDPNKFQDPHHLDICRKPNPHLSFGHGSHFCIGASLARMEAKIAIGELLQWLPNLQLAHPPEWRQLVGFRSLQRLSLLLK